MKQILIIALIAIVLFLIVKNKMSSGAQSSEFKSVNVNEAMGLLSKGGITPLDVRTPEEIANGKINNALEANVTGSDFQTEISKLDTNKTYLVYCRSGVRSVKACNLMVEKGFHNLINLEGGYNAWSSMNK